ncbi:ATP-binding protein [Frankia sp. Cr2]|uniref:ATP-binding protein n=1 Tax=Frankia sp. Cr2 TaxID=3073932 RepID=UPI002AD46997|nr:ATP-binding protein [Frankia sp. Cr2]
MEIKFSLSLPRDEISIPVVRRMCTQSLKVLGAHQECVDDVELALTEACANVLKHAQAYDWYEVSVNVDNQVAAIEVLDNGGGFDVFQIDAMILEASADDTICEDGRGIYVMHELMDSVQFDIVDGPHPGIRVHLEKLLQWDESAPATRLERAPAHCGS